MTKLRFLDASVKVFLLLPVLFQGSPQPVLRQIHILGVDILGRGTIVQLCTTPIFVDLFHKSSTKNTRFRSTTAEESLGVL